MVLGNVGVCMSLPGVSVALELLAILTVNKMYEQRFIFLFSVHDEVLSPNCSSSPSDSQSNIILCCATRNTARLSFMKIIYTDHKSNIILFEEKDLQGFIEYVIKFIML